MDENEFNRYIKPLIEQTNERLKELAMAMNASSAILKESLQNTNKGISAHSAVTQVVLGVLCEMSPEFRTILLRIADSQTDDPFVQEALAELKTSVAQYHKLVGAPITLKPVK